MKKITGVIFAAVIICVFLSGCLKKEGAGSSQTGKTALNEEEHIPGGYEEEHIPGGDEEEHFPGGDEEEHFPGNINDTVAIYSATTNLRLRSAPDTSVDNQIASVPQGSRVVLLETGRTDTINGITAPWYRVQWNKGNDIIEGWVFSGYLKFEERAF